MKRSIIFDLDGTLVDSSAGILGSIAAAFRELGLHPALELTPSLIGPPLRETMLHLCNQQKEAPIEALVASFKSHYDSAGFLQTVPFPGVVDMLKSLLTAGMPLYIATNKRNRPTLQILNMLGWSSIFYRVVSPDSFNPALPSKAAILGKLLDEDNLESKNCLYIGDRFDDYNAAMQTSVSFALAEWGFEGDGSQFPLGMIRMQRPDASQLISRFFD